MAHLLSFVRRTAFLAFFASGTVLAHARADDATLFGSYLAGRYAASVRDNAAAADFYREALRQDPTDEVILERAFLLDLSAGNMEAASTLAKRIVNIDAGHRLARLMLGVEAIQNRHFKTALHHFAQGSSQGPIAGLTTAFMTAWAEQGAGNVDAALKTLQSLEGADWFRIYRAFHSALIADLGGRRKLAEAQFAEAYKFDGSVLRVVEAYSRFLARIGKVEEARTILSSFDKVSENHPLIAAVRADLDAGRVPKPVVKNTAAGAAEGLYEIGAALGREGGEELGIVYLQLALYLDPGAPLPLLSLADIYERQKNHELAAEAYGGIAQASSLWRSAQIQRVLNLNALQRVDEARAVLRKLIDEDPTDIEAIKALGDILRGHKEFTEAARVYSKAIALLDPVEKRHWPLFYFRGIAYERSKEWPKAEADLSEALKLSPDQPFVLNYLGYSWIDQGKNLDRAMEMIRKAVELRPEDGYIVDSLGWAHFRLGNYKDAVSELERAIELRPEDPVINDHLGDAYWQAGRKLEARFQWSHARDMKPEPEDLARIEDKLKNGLTIGDDGISRADAQKKSPKNGG